MDHDIGTMFCSLISLILKNAAIAEMAAIAAFYTFMNRVVLLDALHKM